MITLEQSDREFKTNANGCGMHLFSMVKRGVNPEGSPVYIYSRAPILSEDNGSYKLGRIFGFEVFIPKIIKAGTVCKFPGGKEVTVTEDTEFYPNGAKTDFGKRAWFCATLEDANKYFDNLMKKGAPVDVIEEEEEEEEQPAAPRVKKEISKFPEGEFSCQELATLNDVSYPIAFMWLKEQVQAGKVIKGRTEQRAAKGRATQLFTMAMAEV